MCFLSLAIVLVALFKPLFHLIVGTRRRHCTPTALTLLPNGEGTTLVSTRYSRFREPRMALRPQHCSLPGCSPQRQMGTAVAAGLASLCCQERWAWIRVPEDGAAQRVLQDTHLRQDLLICREQGRVLHTSFQYVFGVLLFFLMQCRPAELFVRISVPTPSPPLL